MQPVLVAYATSEGHTRMIAEFIEESGLKPRFTRCVAGALKYTHDDYVKHWCELEAFVDDFLATAPMAGIGLHAA
jgi:menaquinone-dependent protoporphyrinogen IX oxidase